MLENTGWLKWLKDHFFTIALIVVFVKRCS